MLDSGNYSLIVMVTVGSLGLLLSMITLWLVYAMKRWNIYLQLVCHLTFCQALYDMSIVMEAGGGNTWLRVRSFFRICSGLSATLWTNVISAVVVYLIIRRTAVDVRKHFPAMSAAIYIPSIVLGLANAIDRYFWSFLTYYFARLISIIVNIVLYLVLSYTIYMRDKESTSNKSTSGDAIKTLAYRMKYYPLAQIISRVGAAWFEIAYSESNNYDERKPLAERASLMLYAATLPAAGVMFFLIFITVSPGAKEQLISLLNDLSCRSFGTKKFELKSPDDSIIVINDLMNVGATSSVMENNSINNNNPASPGSTVPATQQQQQSQLQRQHSRKTTTTAGGGGGGGADCEGWRAFSDEQFEVNYDLYDEDKLQEIILSKLREEEEQEQRQYQLFLANGERSPSL